MSTDSISPLRQRMLDDMSGRRLTPATQRQYILAVKRLAAFLGRSPDTATPEELRAFVQRAFGPSEPSFYTQLMQLLGRAMKPAQTLLLDRQRAIIGRKQDRKQRIGGNQTINNSGTTSFNAQTTAGNAVITTNSGGTAPTSSSSRAYCLPHRRSRWQRRCAQPAVRHCPSACG